MRKYLTQEDIHFINHAVHEVAKNSLLNHELRLQGLHGMDHWARVACIAERIRQLTQDTGLGSKMVMAAALCHDSGRRDDSIDPRHGLKGVVPASRVLVILANIGLIELDYDRMGAMIHTVIHHCDAGASPDMLTRIVKDADRLELMRDSPKRLDESRLELTVSLGLVEEVKPFTKKEWDFEDGLS